MKLENGKIILEEVTCWDCKGTKRVTRYNLCPLNHKAVNRQPHRKCPHCGATRKWDHKTVGSYETDCTVCSATGKEMETRFSHVTQELWNTYFVPKFKWSLVRQDRGATFNENYLGLGYVYGCVDYGRMAAKTDEELMQIIPTDGHPPQLHHFTKEVNGELIAASEMVIVIHNEGYSVVPKWA